MLSIPSLRYFEKVIRGAKDPKAVANQLHYDSSYDVEAKTAVNEAANLMGGFANWLDCAHWAINEVANDPRIGASAVVVHGNPACNLPGHEIDVHNPTAGRDGKWPRGFRIVEKEPECRCDSKALSSYGHEKGCAYMAWKAAKASTSAALPKKPDGQDVMRLIQSHGRELDLIGSQFGVTRLQIDMVLETDVCYRSRILEKWQKS